MKIQNPLIGCDGEVFLMHKQTKEIVSAEGIIKGEKHRPFVFDPNPLFSTMLDNVLGEFTIPPVHDLEGWTKNIKKSMDYIQSILPKELCVAAQPAAYLDSKYLETENAMSFGCSATYNVWERKMNKKPNPNTNLRSAGMHIHFGYDNPNIETTEEIMKTCDLILGVPAILIEPDNERRKLYGKAGEFRLKKYGGEYRVLSSYFLSSDSLIEWTYNGAKKVIDFVNNNRIDEVVAVGEHIQHAINNTDKVIAGNLIRQFEIEML